MQMQFRFLPRLLVLLCAAHAWTASAQAETPPAAVSAVPDPASVAAVDCIEVEMFKVSETKLDKQTDRAEKIPLRNLEIILADVLKHLPRKAKGTAAIAAGQGACPNPDSTAVLKGDILDFRKGNAALRYFVGFGAGSQKVRVLLSLSRKSAGTLIGQAEVADTKWGGIGGGSNTKGLDDFAEKSAEAVAKMLAQK